MSEGWARLCDEESMTFDSADDEQALRQQACDLVKATSPTPPRTKRYRPEVALETAAD